jgi:hypothetical protein
MQSHSKVTAVVREQLCGQVVSPATREHAIMEEKFPVRGIGQGEARHGKYKRLKLCSGQAYDSSCD